MYTLVQAYMYVQYSTCLSASEEDDSDPSDNWGNTDAPLDAAAPRRSIHMPHDDSIQA